jgi:peptide/nickel transport system substrate-binding protein
LWGLVLAAGCQKEPESVGTSAGAVPEAGGTVVIAFPAEPDVLNPLIRASAYTGQILALLQQSLLEMDEDLLWQPLIARNWTLAPDSLSLTYTLRPWRWSDGAPLTAYDVAASFVLYKSSDVASPRMGYYADVLRAVALDSATVRYDLVRKLANPLSHTAHSILPVHVTAHLDPRQVRTWPLNEHPLSSGPFVLQEWIRNQELVLIRNEMYPGPEPLLDRVVLRIIPDETARVIALEAGEADFMEEVPVQAAARILASGQANIHRLSGRLFGYLSFNLRNALFHDRRVRKALSLAIDRQRFIDGLLGGYAKPAASPLPPVLWAHNDQVAPDPYDPASARRLLAEAGWRDRDGDGVLDRDGQQFSFEILTRQGDPVRADGVVVIRENLRQVGIEVRPRVLEHATSLEMLKKGQFAAYLGLFQANLTVDPSSLLHSQATDRFNYGAYSNARVDSLLDLGLSLADRRLAKPVWDRLQEIVSQDVPMIFIYYPETLIAVSTRLQDVRPHVLSPFNNICEWWIPVAQRKYESGAR